MDQFFKLDWIVFTTNAVFDEIKNPSQKEIVLQFVDNGKIQIDSFGNDDFVFRLALDNPGLSSVDCTVIDLAIRKNAILLSSDNSVRKQSQLRNINVHGILWIIKSMVLEGVISSNDGIRNLHEYERINPRTPRKKIKELMNVLTNLEKRVY